MLEYGIAGVDITQVESSGRDKDTQTFSIDKNNIISGFATDLVNNLKSFRVFSSVDFKITHKVEEHLPMIDYYVVISESESINPQHSLIRLTIENVKISTDWKSSIKKYSNLAKYYNLEDVESAFNAIALIVGNSNISRVYSYHC